MRDDKSCNETKIAILAQERVKSGENVEEIVKCDFLFVFLYHGSRSSKHRYIAIYADDAHHGE
jgi:hypothetical protein